MVPHPVGCLRAVGIARFRRVAVDAMEEIVAADYWSVPTYDDILFYMQQTRLILRAKGSRLCEAPSFYAAWTCFELAAERAFRAGHLKSCNLFCHADVSGGCS